MLAAVAVAAEAAAEPTAKPIAPAEAVRIRAAKPKVTRSAGVLLSKDPHFLLLLRHPPFHLLLLWQVHQRVGEGKVGQWVRLVRLAAQKGTLEGVGVDRRTRRLRTGGLSGRVRAGFGVSEASAFGEARRQRSQARPALRQCGVRARSSVAKLK